MKSDVHFLFYKFVLLLPYTKENFGDINARCCGKKNPDTKSKLTVVFHLVEHNQEPTVTFLASQPAETNLKFKTFLLIWYLCLINRRKLLLGIKFHKQPFNHKMAQSTSKIMTSKHTQLNSILQQIYHMVIITQPRIPLLNSTIYTSDTSSQHSICRA